VFNKISVKIAIMVNLILLVVIVAGAFFLIKQQASSLEAQLLERGKIESIVGAKLISRVIETAIDNSALTLEDAFDTDYELIPGFNPEKYHTKYDAYLDKMILAMQDEFFRDESVVYAVTVDANGYLPTHNSKYQQPITGDHDKDLEGNQTKRIFNDSVGLSAAHNKQPGYQQIYNDDTGAVMWDISSPIIIKGEHWGGFRIGFSMDKTLQAQQKLTNTLMLIMAVILIVSLIVVFWVVNNSLKPLVHFTALASELADGNVDQQIESKGQDEMAQLADVLERLRVSLKAAMDRLSKKK